MLHHEISIFAGFDNNLMQCVIFTIIKSAFLLATNNSKMHSITYSIKFAVLLALIRNMMQCKSSAIKATHLLPVHCKYDIMNSAFLLAFNYNIIILICSIL